MLALVRETYNVMQQQKMLVALPQRAALDQLLGRKNEITSIFKRIYSKKLNVTKTRIHGTLSLAQVLLTGKDVAIHDFGGLPSRSYGEARLKRSPFWDVAFMMRSYYYAGYEGFLGTVHVNKEEINALLPYADLWVKYMSGFFLTAYLQVVKDSDFIPKSKDELNLMLQNYLLEKALYALKYELANRPDKTIIPLAMIRNILD